MSPSASVPRRSGARRLVLLLVAAVAVIAVIATVILTLTLRPRTGIAAALEDDDFSSCLDSGRARQIPSEEDAGSWSEEEETAFWMDPAALDCASRQLSEDRRVRALAAAFPSLDGDEPGDVADQWRPIADYAAWLEETGVPRDIAMMRIAGVIRGLWVAHSDDGQWADGFTRTAVLADMRARDELPGFDAWLESTEEDDEGGKDAGVDFFAYRGDVLEKEGEETEQAHREYLDRSRALYDVVR